jgi:hypothetical protein
VRAELLFVLLPLLILLIAHGVRGAGFLSRVLYAADWSFASAVLFGQSIVKFVAGVAARPRQRPWARVAWIVAFVMVFLLAPALVILAVMLILPSPPVWLAVTQLVLFGCGVVCFLVLGGAGQELMDRAGPTDASA